MKKKVNDLQLLVLVQVQLVDLALNPFVALKHSSAPDDFYH